VLDNTGLKKFFDNHWEKMVLWAIVIGLFYLLRPFFILIFETFLITCAAKSLVTWVVRRTALGYRTATVLVFALLVGLLAAVGAWVGPKLVLESNQMLLDFAGDSAQLARDKTNRFVEKIVMKAMGEQRALAFIDSAEFQKMMAVLKAEAARSLKTALPHVLTALLHLVKLAWEIIFSLLLALVFAFILVLDWQRIAAQMAALETSRIRTFYNGAAPHLRAFANVLGRALCAQMIIAACNTALTAAGLWFFGVPNIAILSVIVFCCGFIPIFGVFVSSVPILLFALQAGGLALAFKLAALIGVVHFIEAYVLNPRITAGMLHAHPLLVLVLLLLGERFLGVWGLIVGVPIGYYLINVLTAQDESLPS